MQPIQIQKLEKTLRIVFDGNSVTLPAEIRQKVDLHWAELQQNNPKLHNGEVFTVTSVEETAEAIDIRLAETDYAHYLYSNQVGGLGGYTVRVIHSTALIITADDKIILAAMGAHTSTPGIIQSSAGGIDHDDIADGIVNIDHNTEKELEEELGVDADDHDRVKDFKPVYLKTGGPTGKMTLSYVLWLKQTAEEFMRDYNAFADNLRRQGEDPEFDDVFYIDLSQEAVENFMSEHEGMLNEYIPSLLRAAYGDLG